MCPARDLASHQSGADGGWGDTVMLRLPLTAVLLAVAAPLLAENGLVLTPLALVAVAVGLRLAPLPAPAVAALAAQAVFVGGLDPAPCLHGWAPS